MEPTPQSYFHVLNAQCISPKATSKTKWKIPYISETILNKKGSFVPFLAITESWLKEYMSDAQIKVENYNSFRADRNLRTQGGTLLYIHDTLLVSDVQKYDNKVCSCIMATIEELNCIIASIYRPPDASPCSYKNTMAMVQNYLDQCIDQKQYDIFITGDLNFPNICWSNLTVNNSLGIPGKESAEILLEFMSRNFLNQVVDKPTRENNILDLILTNRSQYICEIQSSKTCLSDHNLVTAVLGFDARSKAKRTPNIKPIKEFTFHQLNLHKADIDKIEEKMAAIDWYELHNICTNDEDGSQFSELVRLTTLQICYAHCPKKIIEKDFPKKPKISKERRSLYRRRRKLKARVSCLKTKKPLSSKIIPLEDEINIIAYKIQQQIKAEINRSEQRAVLSIKENPRFFFSYAKRFSKLKSNIGPLRETDSGKLHHDPQKMSDLLQSQYLSVFSDPHSISTKDTTSSLPKISSSINRIDFTEDDLIEAINEIDVESSTSEDDIPARILKACKTSFSKAFLLLWKNSMKTSTIPVALKEQFITPVYKKGDKTDTANYRPVSLTSHIIKIFERVIRKRMVAYLETNQLFSNKQHGFRKGRSCLTQLLKHYDQVLQNYLNNSETDVIYLDYAKAFDKVDHNLLLKKLKFFGIKGELYLWIKEFLVGRYQTVIVDGFHSRRMPVLSGVPQGSVLSQYSFVCK